MNTNANDFNLLVHQFRSKVSCPIMQQALYDDLRAAPATTVLHKDYISAVNDVNLYFMFMCTKPNEANILALSLVPDILEWYNGTNTVELLLDGLYVKVISSVYLTSFKEFGLDADDLSGLFTSLKTILGYWRCNNMKMKKIKGEIRREFPWLRDFIEKGFHTIIPVEEVVIADQDSGLDGDQHNVIPDAIIEGLHRNPTMDGRPEIEIVITPITPDPDAMGAYYDDTIAKVEEAIAEDEDTPIEDTMDILNYKQQQLLVNALFAARGRVNFGTLNAIMKCEFEWVSTVSDIVPVTRIVVGPRIHVFHAWSLFTDQDYLACGMEVPELEIEID